MSGSDQAEVRRSRRHAARAASVAALGAFIFGFDSGTINGAVTAVQTQFGISDLYLGLVVSATLAGAAVGSWFGGALADKIGRVHTMVVVAAVAAAAALTAGLADGPLWLMAARFTAGIAFGAGSVVGAAYIAEVAPTEIRGRLASLQQLELVLGIFTGLLVAVGLTGAAGGADRPVPWGGPAWRWMFLAAAVPAVAFGLLALRIPPSPRYLVYRGQVERARAVLARFGARDVDGEVGSIQHSLAGSTGRVRLADLRGPRLGLQPIVWVGVLLSLFQQFVGINVIFYYSTSLWHAVGFSEEHALLTSLITAAVNIMATFIAIALIDRVGRRPLLIAGASGMAVALGALAVCFATASGSGDDLALGPRTGLVALLAANLFVLCFAATWGPVVWVLLGEIFTNRIRTTALAIAAATQWVANWLVSTSFPSLADIGLGLTYGIYAGCALLALVFVLRAVPETRGRALEEM